MVLWTAIHALWNYRCEVQFGRQKLDTKKYLATWLVKLREWGKWEEMSVEKKHMERVKAGLAAWIHNRRRLEQLEEPGLIRGESKETRKRKRKEEIKEQVVGQ